jgi:foldase protein PrsA
MNRTRWTALLLGGAITASLLAGCGGVDKTKTVATLDGEAVTLGMANFVARLQQASYDDFYVAYFGEDVWSTSYGDETMEELTKDDALDLVETMYVLQKHMDDYDVTISDEEETAIGDAAAAFIAANSEEALDALGADLDIVEEYLRLLTIKSKMYTAIIADADTEVSDEEANVSDFSYVRVSTTTYTDDDGNSATYTDEEQALLAKTMGIFATEAKTSSLEEAAESNDYTVSSGTFSADNDTWDENLLAALQELEEGELTDVIETDDYYYVARLDAKTNEEETESNRESIISDRQSELYNEVLDGWKEEHEWVVNDKVWAKVTFDNLFTTVAPSTETEETEAEEAELEATEEIETDTESGAAEEESESEADESIVTTEE